MMRDRGSCSRFWKSGGGEALLEKPNQLHDEEVSGNGALASFVASDDTSAREAAARRIENDRSLIVFVGYGYDRLITKSVS